MSLLDELRAYRRRALRPHANGREPAKLEPREIPAGPRRLGWGKYPKGVTRTRQGRYQARIRVGGRLIHLGNRETVEDAAALYREAVEKYGLTTKKRVQRVTP